MANTMIVVTGTSATGKTILSKKLASKFNLSLINKDEIKSSLFFTSLVQNIYMKSIRQ